jgi:3-oxoacyl-[acyl-carrier-protein] synthase II
VSGLEILSCGLVCPAGGESAALAGALRQPPQPAEVTGMYPEPLPAPRAYAMVDFDVRAELGRKGTSFFDRRTALAVVGCGRALRDAGLAVTDQNRDRIGVVVGTTAGSLRSSVEYAAETFRQQPPHLVNPALFPNTVMNCAAGQVAIWFGLHGVNATLAGGPMAFLSVLRYCANLFRTRQADVLLAGAVEEFTPHTAWLGRRPPVGGRSPAASLPGEGGVMFVLRSGGEKAGRRWPDGEVLGVTLGFCPRGEDRVTAIAGCLRRALLQAGPGPDRVRFVAVGGGDRATEAAGWRAVGQVLPAGPAERIRVDGVAGDTPTVAGALELAAILARHRADPELDGGRSVLVGHSPEGAVGAAVIQGWSRGPDRG